MYKRRRDYQGSATSTSKAHRKEGYRTGGQVAPIAGDRYLNRAITAAIKRQVGKPELNYHTVVPTAYSGLGGTWTNWTNSSLALISQGPGRNERLGNMVTVTQIHANFSIGSAGGAGGVYPAGSCRIVCVYDTSHGGGGTLPSVGEVMDVTTADNIRAFRNMNNTGRFRTIFDHTFNYPERTDPTAGTLSSYFSEVHKKGKWVVHYDTGASTPPTLSELPKENIYMCCILPTQAAGVVILQAQVRVRFLP